MNDLSSYLSRVSHFGRYLHKDETQEGIFSNGPYMFDDGGTDPRYAALPQTVKSDLTEEQFRWLSDKEKDTILDGYSMPDASLYESE